MQFNISFDDETINKLGSAIGGGAEVLPLTVTENGVYNAPEGKAYSPVNVNVEDSGSKTLKVSLSDNSSHHFGICIPTETGFNAVTHPIVQADMVFNGTDAYILVMGVGVDAETGDETNYDLYPLGGMAAFVEGECCLNYHFEYSTSDASSLGVYIIHIEVDPEVENPSIVITLEEQI